MNVIYVEDFVLSNVLISCLLLSLCTIISSCFVSHISVIDYTFFGFQLCNEMKIEVGDPRNVICEVVNKIKPSFLILGSHGHSALKRLEQ